MHFFELKLCSNLFEQKLTQACLRSSLQARKKKSQFRQMLFFLIRERLVLHAAAVGAIRCSLLNRSSDATSKLQVLGAKI
jgi:hypothetical protein